MILGVYFNQKNFRRLYKKILEAKMNYLAEEAIKEDVQVLVFSPFSIDWITKNMNGLMYNSISKIWELVVCPFPDIIYDRATFPEKEKKIGRFVRENLYTKYQIPFINNKSCFNKLETHLVLSNSSEIIKHLPDTTKYFHPCQLISFLEKYNSVYIKDSGGKLGKNIFKVQRSEDGFYILSHQSSDSKYSYKLTLQEIHDRLDAYKRLGRNLIIQQGIEVALLDQHPFDVRVLAQKNGLKQWELVDKSIRVAAPGSIVTNISNGGGVKRFDEVIPALFSNSISIASEIEFLVIAVCEALEKKYGSLGELGIDIAIGKDGKVWLLEVNGKPAKLCIYHSGNVELIHRSCINIIKYSKELFKPMNESDILCRGQKMVEIKHKIMCSAFETKDNEFNIMIPLETAKKLDLMDKSNTTLKCGSKSLNASITISSESNLHDEPLWLSKNALEELLIPENIEICVEVMEHGDIIKFGPIIGILTEDFILRNHKKGRFIREDLNLFAEAGKKIHSLIYIFSLNKIDFENERILGYVPQIYNSKVMGWQEQWMPIPDAIHNRIKISPSSPGYRKINAISELVPDLKIINRNTKIYKWTIQKILEKDDKSNGYLPKTLLFKDIRTLTKMLQEFPFVYLKPIGRSLGLGIIKIERDGSDEYTARYGTRGKLSFLSGCLSDILSSLIKIMGKRAYIVQEGIPLATYNGNIFDLRVSVQKDETDTWSISRWKARVASPGSIVTNLSAGGTTGNIKQLMDSVFKENVTKISNDINSACLTICKAIERKISGIGDIGLDIGITEGGRIYFIEANFREHRFISGSEEDIESLENTIKKPIYYLNYLYKAQLQNHKP
jgi:glutathione synthase/RimK-type ligase-like ATP-grasp enzyme